jgi:hypothetical protein
VSPLKIEIPSKKFSAGSVAWRDLILALKALKLKLQATKPY